MRLLSHHVLVWVSDMERAVKFYTEILGLPLIYKSPRFSKVAGEKFWISLHLNSRTEKDRRGCEGPIINFKPADVDMAHDELKKMGVEFYRPPYIAAPNVKVAEFFDTEGNKLSLSSAD